MLCIRILALWLGLWLGLGPAAAQRSDPQAAARKFERVVAFSARVGALRQEIAQTLSRPQVDRATAVAAIVRLMDSLCIRVGSERYASGKPAGKDASYGASSLRKEHVRVDGDTIHLSFPGKSHVAWARQLVDPQLAAALRLFLALPGERLFQVPSPGGGTSPVIEAHVRELLAPYGAHPKDFRTLHANRLLEEELARLAAPRTRREANRNLKVAIKNVASVLHHTPAVCRSSYLDGRRLEAYAAGLPE